jgi:hypothetical protein
MALTDPFGAVVTLLRADTAVAAIVSTRVSSEVGTLPCVQIIDSATTRRPFGPGSASLGLQLWSGFARCYAADTPTGAVTARQLAAAVSDALHGIKARVGSRYIARAWAPDIDGMERDPELRYPFYDVRLELYAAA